MTFATEPAQDHARGARTAVLLCNLGTPDEPTAASVRRYLAQFLSDPRVVEIPRWIWMPLLHGVILRTRPAKSAAKYASIWTDEGSPLRIWTQSQATLLAGYLGERGHAVIVRAAMRYGSPSIESQLDALREEGVTRVLVLPLYPQYAASTTASVIDAVTAWSRGRRWVPELRFVNQYHDHAGYIAALEARVREHWRREGRPERTVLSFHGVPARSLALGDPYHCQCLATARLLRERLELGRDELLVTFQSRFGRARWLEPYTEPTVKRLASEGIRRLDVFCPGFTSDCLETLEEIGQEVRDAFLASGGTTFHHIACLNDSHSWIAALSAIAIANLQGWPVAPEPADILDARQQRAQALGAAT